MKRLMSCVVFALCSAIPCNAGGTNVYVLTFDDIMSPPSSGPMAYWYYSGLNNWTNFWAWYGPAYPGTALDVGRVSGDYVAADWSGGPGEIGTASADTFDFYGAYFTPEHMDCHSMNLRAIGYLAGEVKYDVTVPLSGTPAEWIDFDYVGIDMLRFWPYYGGFAMDNLTLGMTNSPFPSPVPTAVPAPGAVVLVVMGLCCGGFRRRSS